MPFIVSLISGLIFGLGLIIGGMANPQKILNFLDIFGQWDPSLIFMMGAAVITTFLGFRYVLKNERPILAGKFELPTRKNIDKSLIIGAALFGIGWGLGGFCPGPALTSISLGATGTYIFVLSMIAGMWGAKLIRNRN